MDNFNEETFEVGDIVYIRIVPPTFEFEYDERGCFTGKRVNTDTMRDTLSFVVTGVCAVDPCAEEHVACKQSVSARLLTTGPLTKGAVVALNGRQNGCWRSGWWFTKEKPATWSGG